MVLFGSAHFFLILCVVMRVRLHDIALLVIHLVKATALESEDQLIEVNERIYRRSWKANSEAIVVMLCLVTA